MIFHYRAFGLDIASEFKCPALLPGDGTSDVRMYHGAVPNTIEQATYKSKSCEAKPNQLLFRIDGAARYLVSDGKTIVVDRAPDSTDEKIQPYLLNLVFSALLYQRGTLPLHGSAIETPKGAVIFVGQPGIGKSTLAGAFHVRGYRIITDDLCAISTSADSPPMTYPGYPEMKMTPDTAEKLGIDTSNLKKITWWKGKLIVPFRERFSQTPLPVHAVYSLTESEGKDFTLTPAEGVEKFKVLSTNTYRMAFLEGLGLVTKHFKLATAVVQHARVVHVSRPRGGFRLDELIEVLEMDCGLKGAKS